MLNNRISTTLASPNALMNQVIEGYLKSKGKQIRPIIVILSAKLLGEINENVISAATAVELLHNATLIHDDVVDDTKLRRGQPTINNIWDNHIAVLVGDFFLSSALLQAIETNDIKIIKTSSFYETEPWGNKDLDWFVNAVIEVKTKLSPVLGENKLTISTEQNIDKSNEVQIKNKRVENIITVFGVIIVLIVAAFGLWKLSGEDNKPSKQLVFTVGDQEVYQDEVNLCIIQNTIDLGVSGEHLDTATAEDGTLAADYYKQQILDVIMDYKVEYVIAKKQGLTLTEQEEKEVLLDVVEYMGKVDARVLNQWGVTQELIEEVYKQRYLARKLETEVLADVDVDEVTYCTVYLMLFPKLEMNEDVSRGCHRAAKEGCGIGIGRVEGWWRSGGDCKEIWGRSVF